MRIAEDASQLMTGLARKIAATCAASMILFSAEITSASTIASSRPNDQASYYIVGGSGPFTYVEAIGWSQADAYSDVAISALVGSLGGNGAALSAYLTSALGPAAGPPIASRVATAPSFASSREITSALLFSGLTLGPGIYYLTLFDPDPTATVAWAGASSLTLAPGGSIPGQYIAGNSPAFGSLNPSEPWRSTFLTQPIDYFFYDPKGFTVTGTLASAVPEGSTFVLTGAAIGTLLLVGRRRPFAFRA